jgi:hypothetical protein
MINLIKLQPSLSIVLVAFHATEIQCIKQGYGVTHHCVQQSACKAIQILITIDYFNSLRFFHFRVGRRYAVSECPLVGWFNHHNVFPPIRPVCYRFLHCDYKKLHCDYRKLHCDYRKLHCYLGLTALKSTNHSRVISLCILLYLKQTRNAKFEMHISSVVHI